MAFASSGLTRLYPLDGANSAWLYRTADSIVAVATETYFDGASAGPYWFKVGDRIDVVSAGNASTTLYVTYRSTQRLEVAEVGPSSAALAATSLDPTGGATGATSRTLAQFLGNEVSPEQFGAAGDGLTDDCAAIQAALDYLDGIGGGLLRLGAKTYLLGTVSGSNSTLLSPRSNVVVEGHGDASVLKVKAGLNTNSLTFNVLCQWSGDATTPILANAQFKNFCIDYNGANNAVPALGGGTIAPNAHKNLGIGGRIATDILVENILFKNNPGTQDVAFGNNDNTWNTKRVVCHRNRFHNVGTAVNDGAGTTVNTLQTDHSCFYLNVDTVVVSDNLFTNDIVGSREATMIEMHSINGSVHNNHGKKFAKMFNPSAQIADGYNMVYANNTLENGREVMSIGNSSTFVLKDHLFTGNICQCDINDNACVDLDTLTLGSVQPTSLVFQNERYSCTAAAGTNVGGCFRIGAISLLTIRGGLFSGFGGRGILAGTHAPTAGTFKLELLNAPEFSNCCQNTAGVSVDCISLNIAATLGRVKMQGVRVTNTGAGRITVGGTYHAGDVLTVTIAGTALNPYTVVAGDANLQGTAQALAAWLNLEPTFAASYVAEARNLDVVISTLTSGVSTTLTAAVTGSGNSVTLTVAASPFITYMVKAISSNAAINDIEILDCDLEGVAGSFNFSNANNAPFIRHRGVGSPAGVIQAALGSEWADRNSALGDRYEKLASLGLSAGWKLRRFQNGTTAPTSGILVVGDRTLNINPASTAIQGYECTTAGARKSGTWANAAVYTAGTWILASNSKVYYTPSGGTAATGSEPSHSSGSATGADGIVWVWKSNTAALVATIGSLGTAG